LYGVTVSNEPVILTQPTLPEPRVGVPYSQALTATGPAGPYTFAVTAGALPAGLTLSSGGLLAGTPTGAGAASFTVTATSVAGVTGTLAYTTAVAPALPAPPVVPVVFGRATLPNGGVGVAYSQALTASGPAGPFAFTVTAGALPAGVTLSAGGLLSGTPTAAGTASFTVTATNPNGTSGTQAYTITLAPAAPVVPPPVVPVRRARFAVGSDVGGPATANLVDTDGSVRLSVTPFGADFTGGVRVAAADFTGDGVPDLVAGTGPGVATSVRVLDGVTGAELFSLAPFEATFTGGVFVAAGDLTGDGVPDLVITPDEGGGPRVRAFGGKGFGQIADFFGVDDLTFRGGARAAVGDVSGDGVGDLLVAAGFGGGPRVAGFDGPSVVAGNPTRLFGDFFAFENALRNGVYLAAGDLDGDGFAEVVAGAGPGGGPRVSAFAGKPLVRSGEPVRTVDFFAGDGNDRKGVRVAAKDLDGDAQADLVTGSATTGVVTTYAGKSLTAGGSAALTAFDAMPGGNGVSVG